MVGNHFGAALSIKHLHPLDRTNVTLRMFVLLISVLMINQAGAAPWL